VFFGFLFRGRLIGFWGRGREREGGRSGGEGDKKQPRESMMIKD